MGIARSGTTMTAKVLQALGIDMGFSSKNLVAERLDITFNLENRKIGNFLRIVRNQNEKQDIWGWKRPKAFQYVHLFENKIRNPHFIVPFRDYVAIANRINLNTNNDFKNSLIDTHRKRYNLLIDFIEKNEKPIFIFSYEKAIIDKAYYVKSLAGFLGIKDNRKIEKAINKIEANDKEYINKSNRIRGRIGRIKNGRVMGWAKAANLTNPVSLKIFINEKFYKKIIANKKNKQQPKASNNFFNVAINDIDLVEGSTYKISVLNHNDEHLKNSPFTYTH